MLFLVCQICHILLPFMSFVPLLLKKGLLLYKCKQVFGTFLAICLPNTGGKRREVRNINEYKQLKS